MSDGRIDREMWSTVLAGLIASFDPGNKSAFSRRVGFTTRTIDRWLKQEVDITFESLTRVMNALKLQRHEELEVMRALGLIHRPAAPPPDGEFVSGEEMPGMVQHGSPVPNFFEEEFQSPVEPRLLEQPPVAADPRDDPIIQTIMADVELTEGQRSMLVDLQLKRMEEDYRRRREAYDLRVKADMDRRRTEYENIRRFLGPSQQAS